MLEVREWVAVIVTALVVTIVAVLIGSLLDIGFLKSGGWLIGVAAGIVMAFGVSRRDK